MLADLKRAQWLKLQALFSFRKHWVTSRTAERLAEVTKRATARKMFQAWENAYQLKLWRRHFFNCSYRFIIRRSLRLWKQRAQARTTETAMTSLLQVYRKSTMRKAMLKWQGVASFQAK